MPKHLTPESSTIASIDHDGNNKLTVEFKSGGEYHYDVPESVYHAMKSAPSAGKFHHANVKGKFSYVKAALVLIALLFTTDARAQTTDWMCMQQCESQGYTYGLCMARCSY